MRTRDRIKLVERRKQLIETISAYERLEAERFNEGLEHIRETYPPVTTGSSWMYKSMRKFRENALRKALASQREEEMSDVSKEIRAIDMIIGLDSSIRSHHQQIRSIRGELNTRLGEWKKERRNGHGPTNGS